jgi:hypothetical protein
VRAGIFCSALLLAAAGAAAGARADIVIVVPSPEPNTYTHPEPSLAARIARERAIEWRIDRTLWPRSDWSSWGSHRGCFHSGGAASILTGHDGRVFRESLHGDPLVIVLPRHCW